jgi:hypothetical protein
MYKVTIEFEATNEATAKHAFECMRETFCNDATLTEIDSKMARAFDRDSIGAWALIAVSCVILAIWHYGAGFVR